MTHPTPRPQDDLYQAVNAEWFTDTEIPEDQPIYGALHELRDQAEAACREIVERAAADPGPAGTPQQLIGDLYASFMDTDRIEAAGTAPIADQLAAVEGIRSVEDFARVLGVLVRQGVSGLFGLAISTDADDPDHYLTHLYQGGLGLPDESYYREEQYEPIRAAYLAYLSDLAGLAGLGEGADLAAEVMGLETDIAAVHWDRVRSRDRSQTHNPMDRARLDELLVPEYWTAYLAGLEADAQVLARAEVMQPSFFTGLAELLTAERLPAWRCWLTARVIRAFASYGPDALVEANFDFYGRTLSGTPQLRARWKRGVGLVEGMIGEALGEVYVAEHFQPGAKAQIQELVGHLIEAYRRNIAELPWMTAPTRERALDKLAAFTPKVGYPDKFERYPGLVIDRYDLVGNVRRATAAEWDRELAKVGTDVDRGEWFMTPQTVNAYYNPGMNEIVFPAAILRPPMFDPAAGAAANFGGIGAVIGHEIGHGFDDQGSKYDGAGALRDWWTAEDRAAFEQLTGKLIDQYSALVPTGADGQHVNGELTIGENIGDLGGLGIAYQAWLLAAGAMDDADRKSGAQALFSNWARAWRVKTRPAEVVRRLAIDPHSPPEFRCNQVVRNLDEFYTAFDVGPEDALWLDPADRVRIW